MLSFSFEVGMRQGRVTLPCKSLRGVSAPNTESETVWSVQCFRKTGKQGIQVGNIAGVENSSCVSHFAVGTIVSLELTKSRTTTTRSGRHRGRFGMGDRKDGQE